jgi:DNA-binding MarR family transcriptional regulator
MPDERQPLLPRGDRQLARRLLAAASETHRYFPRGQGAGDLEPLAMQVLLCLYLEAPMKVKEVAEWLEVGSAASVSRALRSLQGQALLRDVAQVGPGRGRPLELTPAGSEAVKTFLRSSRQRRLRGDPNRHPPSA